MGCEDGTSVCNLVGLTGCSDTVGDNIVVVIVGRLVGRRMVGSEDTLYLVGDKVLG